MGARKGTSKRAETLSQRGTAAVLGVSPQKLLKLIEAGQAPPFFWLGDRRFWRPETVDKWLRQQEAANSRQRRAVNQ